MFHNLSIHITLNEIATGFVLYGIIHGLYKLIWKLIAYLFTKAGNETSLIIREHVRQGHKQPVKKCFTEECAKLQTGSRLQALHQQ